MGKILSVTQKGNFNKTEKFLHRIVESHYLKKLRHYGEMGVTALSNATPKDTGKTAESWSYVIDEQPGRTAIYWKNSNIVRGVNIALILRYGHATRNGGFIEGIDYISPAIQPIFEKMADEAWKEVVR